MNKQRPQGFDQYSIIYNFKTFENITNFRVKFKKIQGIISNKNLILKCL